MKSLIVQISHKLRIATSLPGDKSLSHRAAIFSSIANGVSVIKNYLVSEDCLNTIQIFKQMGVKIKKEDPSTFKFEGLGLQALKPSNKDLYCGNSGTTMRLLAGLLAGLPFESRLTGDKSLYSRPMNRVIKPLVDMGANVVAEGKNGTAPLKITPATLKSIKHKLKIPSAQIKSSILLAGLSSSRHVIIHESIATRDHTERYLKLAKAAVNVGAGKVTLKPTGQIKPVSWTIPGDISSAAFFIAMGCIVPKSTIKLKNLLWNRMRTGLVKSLKTMGADIRVSLKKTKGPEAVADLEVRYSSLKPVTVTESEVPSMIDELPILMVIMTQAKGQSVMRGVGELRIKETNRVDSMVGQLKRMGAQIECKGDDIYINGPTELKGCVVQSHGDHRTAMSFAVAGMIASGITHIKDVDCIATSFPQFVKLIKAAGANCRVSKNK